MIKKETKAKNINIRLTEKEYKQIKESADLYAGGNISLWLIYSSTKAEFANISESIEKRNK